VAHRRRQSRQSRVTLCGRNPIRVEATASGFLHPLLRVLPQILLIDSSENDQHSPPFVADQTVIVPWGRSVANDDPPPCVPVPRPEIVEAPLGRTGRALRIRNRPIAAEEVSLRGLSTVGHCVTESRAGTFLRGSVGPLSVGTVPFPSVSQVTTLRIHSAEQDDLPSRRVVGERCASPPFRTWVSGGQNDLLPDSRLRIPFPEILERVRRLAVTTEKDDPSSVRIVGHQVIRPTTRPCSDSWIRFQTLTELKLAVEERPGMWRLVGGWKESLIRLGEQNDRIERLYPIVGEKAVEYQFVDPKLPLSNLGAVVVGKGLHDELSGEMFIAVQATTGQGYYIPVRPEVAESLHRGDKIRVAFKAENWLKPADRAIAQVAKENGGVYAPREHQRELETKQDAKVGADALSPANLIEGNIRRLERLGAYGLVTQLPDGRWRVPFDLIAQLESRELTHSRSRLQIDKFSPPQREPAAPPITDLEKERVTIGEGVAQRLGLAFVANPLRFRGQLVPAPAGPSGTEYVQVVDYRHRQLALVPKPKEAERLRGKVVTITRDPAGRLSIQSGQEISR
jgi:Protein of unknown function (DUF3363)